MNIISQMNFQRALLDDVCKYVDDFARFLMKKINAGCIGIYTYERDTRCFYCLQVIGNKHYLKNAEIIKLGNELPLSIIRKKFVFIGEGKSGGLIAFLTGALIIPIKIKNNLSGLLVLKLLNKSLTPVQRNKVLKEVQMLCIFLKSLLALKTMSEEIRGLNMVGDINRIVATELNPERLYYKMYEQIKRIVKVKNLRIDLYYQDKHCMKPVFFIHNGKKLSVHPFINISNSALFSEIFKRKRVVLSTGYKNFLKDKDIVPEMKVNSFIALPLIAKDNLLGVMMCWEKDKKNIFTRKVVRFLKLMARQSAIAIYNARLFEQLNRAINDLTLLYQIEYNISSILNIDELLKVAVNLIDTALGNIITTILMPDEKNEMLVIKAMTPGIEIKPGFEYIPFYRGIVGEAMRTKRLVYVPDVDKDERYVPAIEGVKSEVAIPLIAGLGILGIIDFQSKIEHRFDLMTIDLLSDIAHRIATFLENATLYEKIEKNYADTIKALILAMEAKDSYTRGHSERVTELAMRLAEKMGVSDGRKKVLYWAGLLHDIGKIGISEAILNKPGQLDEFEFSEIKRHPVEGAKMLEPIEGLKEVVPIIRHHHENFDGTGYPDGLKGDEIPLESRILAVCDVYDAMTTVRSYRNPFSHEGALKILESFSGTRLDPEIVKKFIKMMQIKKFKGG